MMHAPTTRREARRHIVDMANATRRRHLRNQPIRMGGYIVVLPAFTLRTLQQAVAVVRHQRIVSGDVLVMAGFKAAR